MTLPLLCLLVAAVPSRAAGPHLGPLLRVTTPGSTLCPEESEPAVASTSAGTWVAYNDDGGCPSVSGTSFTGLQLLPRGGGAARVVTLPPLPAADGYFGDPALAPDGATGGVVLATLRFRSDTPVRTPAVAFGALRLSVFRVAPDLSVTALPETDSDEADKELVAVDPRDRSVYLVWDDTSTAEVVLQVFRGGRWSKVQVLSDDGEDPDVAVGPKGQVAVAISTPEGVAVRTSRDGKAFGAPVTVMTGSGPGRSDPSCPLRPTIGNRQRAIKSPRVAYDRTGRLHVVASLGGASLPATNTVLITHGIPSDAVGGQGRVLHAVSSDGTTFSPARAVSPVEGPLQWNPAVAATPDGGVAVSYLQTADGTLASYDARAVAISPRGVLGTPVVLSSAVGELPPAQEAIGNSNCYGIGDYTGLAATPTGVVAAWPTTVGTAMGPRAGDADIAVRELQLR